MLIEHIIYLLSIFELTVFYTARVVTQPASISDAICGLCKFKTLLNLNFNKIMMIMMIMIMFLKVQLNFVINVE